MLWVRNDLLQIRTGYEFLSSGSFPCYLCIFRNNNKKHLIINLNEESSNYLPFSNLYYSHSRIRTAKIRNKILIYLLFYSCLFWIREKVADPTGSGPTTLHSCAFFLSRNPFSRLAFFTCPNIKFYFSLLCTGG